MNSIFVESTQSLENDPEIFKRMKKLVFWILMLTLTYLSVEGVSIIGYALINHSLFSSQEAKKEMNSNLTPKDDEDTTEVDIAYAWRDYIEVLHPYFGFVADPDRSAKHWQVSDFGFPASHHGNPILKRSDDKRIIGIMGGSLARQLYLFSHPQLKTCLDNAQGEKEIIFFNLSANGYKQPQQLLILTTLLALGAEFDVIINVDGFNEVALPPVENIPFQVNPFYPRLWHRRTKSIISQTEALTLGHAIALKYKKKNWAHFFSKHHLYHSPTLATLWQLRDRAISRSIYKLSQTIEKKKTSPTRSFKVHGPRYPIRSEAELYRDLVAVWKQSSLQMKNLCDANQCEYYHFLQPNQYLPGSKPMGAKEKKRAFRQNHPFKKEVEKGYPLLRHAGKQLRELGVHFEDLSMIYAKNEEELYVDDCCHVNQKGSSLIAERICNAIRPNVKKTNLPQQK